MSQFAREHPEDYEQRLEAMLDAADMERKRRKEEGIDPLAERERIEADRLRDTDPGRWPDWASLAHIRRDIAREQDEDRMQR